jgi:hypothetical protein
MPEEFDDDKSLILLDVSTMEGETVNRNCMDLPTGEMAEILNGK